jgi:hypothetical protein
MHEQVFQSFHGVRPQVWFWPVPRCHGSRTVMTLNQRTPFWFRLAWNHSGSRHVQVSRCKVEDFNVEQFVRLNVA